MEKTKPKQDSHNIKITLPKELKSNYINDKHSI